MGWLRTLTGKGEAPGETGSGTPDAIDRDLADLLAAHGLAAFERQLRLAELVEDRAWQLDQEAGVLRMGDDLAFPAQVLGSISTAGGTWRWAWASSMDPTQAARAREALAIGERDGHPALTTPTFPLRGPGLGHLVGMAISGLLDADAYYRCPSAGGEAYVLLEVPAVRVSADAPLTRAVFTLTRAVESMPLLLTRPGIAAYLRGRGLPVTETEREIRVGDGGEAILRFDRQGRLTELVGTLA